MTSLAEFSGPICNRCGVLYVPEGDGQECTEGSCSGRVTWEATTDRLARQLAQAVSLAEWLVRFDTHEGAEERRTITLTKIIARAQAVLDANAGQSA